MCVKKPECITLPEQKYICEKERNGCRYIEVKTGCRTWEKRLAVLDVEEQGPCRLLLYKYFLFGVSAGKPYIGTMYVINKLENIQIQQSGGQIIIRIVTKEGEKVVLRFDEKDSEGWLSILRNRTMMPFCPPLTHQTHFLIKKHKSMMRNDLEIFVKEEQTTEDVNEYTGVGKGYVQPTVESLTTAITKVSSESLEKTQSLTKTIDLTKESATQGTTEEGGHGPLRKIKSIFSKRKNRRSKSFDSND